MIASQVFRDGRRSAGCADCLTEIRVSKIPPSLQRSDMATAIESITSAASKIQYFIHWNSLEFLPLRAIHAPPAELSQMDNLNSQMDNDTRKKFCLHYPVV